MQYDRHPTQPSASAAGPRGRTTATTPLQRIGDPDEIAGAAVFLASRAGAFMTGQKIVVDGGATISGLG